MNLEGRREVWAHSSASLPYGLCACVTLIARVMGNPGFPGWWKLGCDGFNLGRQGRKWIWHASKPKINSALRDLYDRIFEHDSPNAAKGHMIV